MKPKRLIVILTMIIMVIIILSVFRLNDNHLSAAPNNIFLISIDTIRADHLSCYGYQHKTTPNIDAFADNAVLFEHCFANIPLTLPSHATMLTGLIPPTHGVQDNGDMALSDSVVTLPEMLQEKGYTTYGIIGADILDHRYGLNQGFDVYDDIFESEFGINQLIPQRLADETVAHALTWLDENQDEKKFMFLHFYDPHAEYTPPTPFDKQFKDPYDGEIAFTDHCIGMFIDKLKSLGKYDDSLIIIVGDHAELLGEHGETTHSYFIYHNVLAVPLIIKPPFHTKPVKIKDNTTLTDIAPTIMAQCDIGIPANIQGIDLSDYFDGEDEKAHDRVIFNESLTATKYNGNSLFGMIQGQWHYIQTTRPELYNWVKDPVELNNLHSQQPQRSRILQKHLNEILEDAVLTGKGSNISLDSKSVQALESLGYVGGSIDTDFSFDQSKPDPKDLYNIHTDLQNVAIHTHDKEYDKAIKICKKVIARYPDILPPYDSLANIYFKTQEYDKAIDLAKIKLSKTPTDIGTMKILADAYHLSQKHEQAIAVIEEQILKIAPDDAENYNFLAQNYRALNQFPEALANYNKTLELDEDHLSASIGAGEICNKMGKLKEMIKHNKKALILDDNLANSHNDIAWAQGTNLNVKLYDPASALIHAQKAVELSADITSNAHEYYPYYLDTLSIAQSANGQFDEAIKTAALAISLLQEANNSAAATEVIKHLELFKQHKTYRE